MNHENRLKHIIKSSGWSQEQLAAKLSVTFATLNSWVNGRSVPRAKALLNIEKLYHDIIGSEEIDQEWLAKLKQEAFGFKISPKDIIEDKLTLDKLTLHLTYHTNTIEGSTMTLSDVGDVIFDNKVLSNRTAIEQVEARNHHAALHWLIDILSKQGPKFQITEELICSINLRLMNGIISDAGMYRNYTVRIAGSRSILANWLKVPELMASLVGDMSSSSGDIITLIASTHARFEQIHPFSDGNGRTGRLIMLAQALHAGIVPPLVVKERKSAYYKYLELAQTKEIYDPLEMFVAESMLFTYSLLNS